MPLRGLAHGDSHTTLSPFPELARQHFRGFAVGATQQSAKSLI
jgi:hypothetical protein